MLVVFFDIYGVTAKNWVPDGTKAQSRWTKAFTKKKTGVPEILPEKNEATAVWKWFPPSPGRRFLAKKRMATLILVF